MKSIIITLLYLLLIITLGSCIDKYGKWSDNIKLSAREVEFNAAGDSAVISTGGNWWCVTSVSVDGVNYYGFPGVEPELDNYTIKQDCFVVERRDKNTLFIKADPNPLNVKRIITVGLEAGDYFDSVRATQKPK